MVYPPQGGSTTGGSTTFIGLADVPASYVGQSLKYVRVNTGETALEFASSSGTVAWDGVTDKPASFTPDTHGNEAHSSAFITSTDITYDNLNANGDVGTGADQVAVGNHTHDYSGTYLGLHATADDSTLWDAYALPATTGNESKFLKLDATGTAFEFGTAGAGTWGSITGTLSDQTDLQTVLNTKAEVGTTVTYYVYEDATGTGDGSSYANGFTSVQAAIDAAPEFCILQIYVRKGSTHYHEDTIAISKHAITSISINAEYYWSAECDANAVAGRIADADINTTGMAVGDRVICMHYSGAVGLSEIDDVFYATVTEFGTGYVQTSEGTKVPTIGWRYLINSTQFDANDTTNRIISVNAVNFIDVNGIGFVNQPTVVACHISNSRIRFQDCIFYHSLWVQGDDSADIRAVRCAIWYNDSGSGRISYIANNSFFSLTGCALSGGVHSGIYALYGSRVYGRYNYFHGMSYALYTYDPDCMITIYDSYIKAGTTRGVYGYNTTFTGTNDATTPITNLTSGGSVEQWDGYDLPSVSGASGEQVLRLNAGKTALEFATVTAGATSFLGLSDTPDAYEYPTMYVRINATNDGLEFATLTITDKLSAVSSNDTTPGYLNGKLVAGTGISLTEGSDGGNETLTIAASSPGDHWISITDGYTATPASTSTITTTSDLTGTLKAGDGLKYTIGGTVYHGQVSVMATNLVTVTGAPLSGDISNLYYTKTGVVQMPILIPGYYEDATNTALIASDLGQTIRWQQRTSYLVNFQAKTRVADSSSDGRVNVRVNGQDISTSNTNAGLTLANTSWTATVVDINTSNYDINYGEEIEVNVTKGTGGTAQDLSLVLTFVVA